MHLDLDALPDDPALLQRLVRDVVTDMERRDGEIEKLRLVIKQLQRAQFGRRSEKLDPDQLALGASRISMPISAVPKRGTPSHPPRRPRRRARRVDRVAICPTTCRARTSCTTSTE